MARKRMVTRTIEVVSVTAMLVDVDAQEFKMETFYFHSLPDNLKEKDYIELCAKKAGGHYVPVKIADITREPHIYGMTEGEFLMYAEDMGTER